jgi:hypothetical protein
MITSRNPSWQELGIPVRANVFDRGESITLLRRRVPPLTDGEAGRIAEALGHLPLTLAQAHLADTTTGVEDYLALLAERATELLAQGVPAIYTVSLVTSAQIALDQLAVQFPTALQLLTLAAYLAPEPIPLVFFTTQLLESLATAATDPLSFTALIWLLRQHGLAWVEPATLALHWLLAAILRTRPHQQHDLPILAVRLLRAAVPADPWHNPPAWPAWRQLLPDVLAVTDPYRTLAGVEEDVAWLLQRAGEVREYERARRLGEDTVTRCRQVLGDHHPHTLISVYYLVATLRELGQYESARQLGEDIFIRWRRVLGDDDPYTLFSGTHLVLFSGTHRVAILRELGAVQGWRPRLAAWLGVQSLDRVDSVIEAEQVDRLTDEQARFRSIGIRGAAVGSFPVGADEPVITVGAGFIL